MTLLKKLSMSGMLGGLLFAAMGFAPKQAHAVLWFNCQADVMFETAGELQVHCTNGPISSNPTVDWVAINIAQVGQGPANRFTSMAEAAILSARKFRIFVENTNCASSPTNCRYASSWSLYVP